MRRFLHSCFGGLLILIAALSAAKAEDQTSMIHVALLDMSSVMPTGMMGYGMMGPGMMNQGMMGQGSGMMNPGMGGYGMMGPGMMMGGMMSIRIDKASIKAGSVTFEVTNWSRSVLHEMLIVSVEGPSSPLPYDYTAGRVPEEQVKVLGEAEDLEPNATKSIEVTLGAGSYLLICNLAGHFAAGMAAPLNVTP